MTNNAAEIIAWMRRSKHRRAMLEAILYLNSKEIQPNRNQAMECAHDRSAEDVNYWSQASITNGRQAIRQLIERGLVANVGSKAKMALTKGPMMDFLEEQNINIRGGALWRKTAK